MLPKEVEQAHATHGHMCRWGRLGRDSANLLAEDLKMLLVRRADFRIIAATRVAAGKYKEGTQRRTIHPSGTFSFKCGRCLL